MRIDLTSVFVDDQEKALAFYTDVLGFVKKRDMSVGDFKWLTVVSAEAPEGVELLLEPDQSPAAQAYKQAIFAEGIPATSFGVDDVRAEHDRLVSLGVRFTSEPTETPGAIVATFDDTCGNLIQLHQIPQG